MLQQLQQQLKKNNPIEAFWKSEQAILILCMGIAFFFWLMTRLSENYNVDFLLPIRFELPPDKILTEPPIAFLDVKIEASGWKILSMNARWRKRNSVLIALKGKKGNERVEQGTIRKQLASLLPSNVRILNILPDNISLQVDKRLRKEVSVLPVNTHLTLAPQYQLVEKLRVSPEKVIIEGPEERVRNIAFCKTESIHLRNLQCSISQPVKIAAFENAQITVEPDIVSYLINVEPFTEVRLRIPIEMIRGRDSLVLMYSHVTVTCTVGLSEFDSVLPSSFVALVDLLDKDLDDITALPIELVKIPPQVRQVRISPAAVEFILIKEDEKYR